MLRPKSLPYANECPISFPGKRNFFYRLVIAVILLLPLLACRFGEAKGDIRACAGTRVQQQAQQPLATVLDTTGCARIK